MRFHRGHVSETPLPEGILEVNPFLHHFIARPVLRRVAVDLQPCHLDTGVVLGGHNAQSRCSRAGAIAKPRRDSIRITLSYSDGASSAACN